MTYPPPPSDPYGGSQPAGAPPPPRPAGGWDADRAGLDEHGSPVPVEWHDPLISPHYGGWWGNGLRIAAVAWKPLLTIQLIAAAVMLALVGALAVVAVTSGARGGSDVSLVAEELLTAIVLRLDAEDSPLAFSAMAIAWLVSVLAMLAAVPVVLASASGQPVEAAAVRRTVVGRGLPLLGWQLVALVIMGVGFLLCLLPGIFAGLVFTPLPVVVALERTGVLGRCFRLFTHSLGPALARTLTVALLPSIVGGALGLIVARVATSVDGGDGVTASLAGGVVLLAVQAVLAVLLVPLNVATYADLRHRSDPHDTSTARLAEDLVAP